MMTDSDVAISMFERIGGSATIDLLVDRFYERMDTLPEAKVIRAMHAADLGLIRGRAEALPHRMDRRPKTLFRRKGTPTAAPASHRLCHR
ncbi:hypothetical protein BRDID11002_84570 [Bradyrhizobium diazoefficiens]